MIKEMVTSEQINSVIDKLSEKLGVAVTQIQPLVGQTIEQYSQMHLAMYKVYSWCTIVAICFMIIVIIGAIITCIKVCKGKTSDEDKGSLCFVTFFALVAFCFIMGCTTKGLFDSSMEHLSAGMSPVTSILQLK